MLSAVPCTRSDFEICYRDDPPTPLHRSLLETSVELKQVLMEQAEAGVVRLGSKLVVPPSPSLSRRQLNDLNRRIPEDVRVIHISRSYFESFYSKLRGGGHWANPNGLSFPKLTKTWFRQNPLAESHPNSRIWVSPDLLQKDLDARCSHEEGLLALARDRQFFLTEYRDIAINFERIANFIGAALTSEHVATIIRQPGTLKIPSIAPEELITNWHVECGDFTPAVFYWRSIERSSISNSAARDVAAISNLFPFAEDRNLGLASYFATVSVETARHLILETAVRSTSYFWVWKAAEGLLKLGSAREARSASCVQRHWPKREAFLISHRCPIRAHRLR